MQRQRVILYGNSVILAALGASLEHFPELELVSLAAPLPEAAELRALMPDVILFDTGSAEPNFRTLFALLQECPALLVVGANPESAQLHLWSSGRFDAVTSADLLQLIIHGPRVQEGGHTEHDTIA
jgi:hypothetical protein